MLSFSGIYVGAFIISKSRIRKEIKLRIKQGVPEHELKLFEFTDAQYSELHFLKPNEFSYQGNLYDIVFREFKDGKHQLKCIDDKQETQLFVQLNQMVNFAVANHSSSNNLSKNAKLTFELKYFQSFFSIKAKSIHQYFTNQFAYRAKELSGYSFQIEKPPTL